MSRYILINHIKVQNANAVAGFTWGFPAVTHFLGFTHNISIKMAHTESLYKDISLNGCAIVCHKHHVLTYRTSKGIEFTQSRNPPYLSSTKDEKKSATAPIVEEGKMNMTVSLLIGCEGNIGNRRDDFVKWLENTCLLQRIAGGTILDIACIEILGSDASNLLQLKRKLLPGYVLIDRSYYLKEHFEMLQQLQPDVELLDAWLDFSALKHKARPKSDLINKHFHQLVKVDESIQIKAYLESWLKHLGRPYEPNQIPKDIKHYFDHLASDLLNIQLLQQWKNYCDPTEKTDADWEYIPKPRLGFLVPIMTGYKAITPLYDNSEIANTRDNETPVCFVESVHSIGEWLSIHRFKDMEGIAKSLWHYDYEQYEEEGNETEPFGWYLCKQPNAVEEDSGSINKFENPEDDFC